MGNFSSSKRSSDTGSQQESNRTCSPLGLLSQAEVAAVKSVMADGASQNNNNNNSNNTVATFFVNSGAFNRALGALSPGDLTELDTALRQWISGADSLDKVKAEWVAHAEVVLRGTRRANRDNLHKCMDHDAICSARVLWLLWQFAESNACSQDEQTTSPILPDEQREVVEALDNSATCVPSSPTNDDTRPKAHDDDAQQVVSEPPPRPPPQSPPQSPPPESPPPPDDTRQAVSSSLSTSSTSPVEAASTSAGEASTSADGSMEVARAGYHQVLCLLRGLIVHATKYQEQHSYGTAKYSSSSSSSSSSATRTAQQSESDSNNSSKNTPSSAALQALSPDAFSSWIDAQVPGLFTPARDFVLACIKRRGGLVSSLGSPSFQLPRLGGTCPSEIVSPVDLFALSCADPALRTTWSPLYLSGRDGRSFTSLVGSVLAYPAATLLLIRDRDNRTFGALAKAPWQESHEFFGGKTGGNGSFLFALRPTFHVFRARGSAAPEAQHFQVSGWMGRACLVLLCHVGVCVAGFVVVFGITKEQCACVCWSTAHTSTASPYD
jgi:hypothetical protein